MNKKELALQATRNIARIEEENTKENYDKELDIVRDYLNTFTQEKLVKATYQYDNEWGAQQYVGETKEEFELYEKMNKEDIIEDRINGAIENHMDLLDCDYMGVNPIMELVEGMKDYE